MHALILVAFAVASFVCAQSSFAADEVPLGGGSTLPPPGTIVAEYSRALGHGFREVARSQVNPPGHFEGIGHFVFIYFENEELCQCGKGEIVISPDGSYAIFSDVNGGLLTLFRTRSRSRKELTKVFLGYPKSATWDLSTERVVVTLERYENGVPSVQTIQLHLQ